MAEKEAREGLFITRPGDGVYYYDVETGAGFQQNMSAMLSNCGNGGLEVLQGRYFIWDNNIVMDTGYFQEPDLFGQVFRENQVIDLLRTGGENLGIELSYFNGVKYLNGHYVIFGNGFAISQDGLTWETHLSDYNYIDASLGWFYGTILSMDELCYAFLMEEGVVEYYRTSNWEKYPCTVSIDFGWTELTQSEIVEYKFLERGSGVQIIGNTENGIFNAEWDGNAGSVEDTWMGRVVSTEYGPCYAKVRDYYLYESNGVVCTDIDSPAYSGCDLFGAGETYCYIYQNGQPSIFCMNGQTFVKDIWLPYAQTEGMRLYGITFMGDPDHDYSARKRLVRRIIQKDMNGNLQEVYIGPAPKNIDFPDGSTLEEKAGAWGGAAFGGSGAPAPGLGNNGDIYIQLR